MFYYVQLRFFIGSVEVTNTYSTSNSNINYKIKHGATQEKTIVSNCKTFDPQWLSILYIYFRIIHIYFGIKFKIALLVFKCCNISWSGFRLEYQRIGPIVGQLEGSQSFRSPS